MTTFMVLAVSSTTTVELVMLVLMIGARGAAGVTALTFRPVESWGVNERTAGLPAASWMLPPFRTKTVPDSTTFWQDSPFTTVRLKISLVVPEPER